jgi:hypothetical protein
MPQPLLASRNAMWISAGEATTGIFNGVVGGVLLADTTGVGVSGMITEVGELVLLTGVPFVEAGTCTRLQATNAITNREHARIFLRLISHSLKVIY